MMEQGRHELAAQTLRWALAREPGSQALRSAQRLAHLRLMEKNQAFNPFKFILYSGEIEQPVAQMGIDVQPPADSR